MKKTICILITIITVLLTSIMSYAEGITDLQKADLFNLGIMVGDEDGDLRLSSPITRAEAVKIICVAGNIDTNTSFENTFPDVSQNHWAYNYICAAKTNQIIEGDENGNFNPEDNITNEEIVKMIVCLLGYEPMADMRGGYPAGYTATGTNIGITKGLQLDVNTPAVRNDVGIMIFNALDIPVMKLSPYSTGSDAVEYVIMDGGELFPLQTLRTSLDNK